VPAGIRHRYECGIDPLGEGWSQSQIRYAFLFVIFDVESVFLRTAVCVPEEVAAVGLMDRVGPLPKEAIADALGTVRATVYNRLRKLRESSGSSRLPVVEGSHDFPGVSLVPAEDVALRVGQRPIGTVPAVVILDLGFASDALFVGNGHRLCAASFKCESAAYSRHDDPVIRHGPRIRSPASST